MQPSLRGRRLVSGRLRLSMRAPITVVPQPYRLIESAHSTFGTWPTESQGTVAVIWTARGSR